MLCFFHGFRPLHHLILAERFHILGSFVSGRLRTSRMVASGAVLSFHVSWLLHQLDSPRHVPACPAFFGVHAAHAPVQCKRRHRFVLVASSMAVCTRHADATSLTCSHLKTAFCTEQLHRHWRIRPGLLDFRSSFCWGPMWRPQSYRACHVFRSDRHLFWWWRSPSNRYQGLRCSHFAVHIYSCHLRWNFCWGALV